MDIYLIKCEDIRYTTSAESICIAIENFFRKYKAKHDFSIERVDGVADLFFGGGTKDELHVVVEPETLAAYGLSISDVIASFICSHFFGSVTL